MSQAKPRHQSFWGWLRAFFHRDLPQVKRDPEREARNSFLGFVLGHIERPTERRRGMSKPTETEDERSSR